MSDVTPYVSIPAERLEAFVAAAFAGCDVPAEDAAQAARVLLASDRRGIGSHGVARLHDYVTMLRAGRINPRPQPRIVRETVATAVVDGDNGLGLVVGPWANRVAIDKALAAGTGWVTVRNSNHYGIAGYYALEAVRRGCIGWSTTNSIALVAPFGGRGRWMGTNPIAFAVPAGSEPPLVVDLATSAVPYGRVEQHARKGLPLVDGWATRADGSPTNDPAEMTAGGALLPLGSTAELSGHKGTCLAALVDVLSAVLPGANWGPFAPPFKLTQPVSPRTVGEGLGHCFGAWSIAAFDEPAEFKARMDEWIRTLRATPPAPGVDRVRVPGDPEREAEGKHASAGIGLLEPVWRELQEVARLTGTSLVE